MNSKLTAPFLLFTLAVLLWSSAAALSAHLAQPANTPKHSHSEPAGEVSEGIKALRKEAASNPDTPGLQLKLASALQEEAFAKRDNSLLMEAVQAYSAVLTKSPEHADALLGMATLCFEAGILDKAIEYFKRYITERPADLRARTDLSLAYIQANQPGEAMQLLEEVVKVDPKLFQAQVAIALVMKLQGEDDAAKAKIEEAKKLAPTDEDRARIDAFLKNFQSTPPDGATRQQQQPQAEGNVSPAQQVSQVFQSHPIVGPKLRGISWPELNSVKVLLDNFPVEQMPPFAKEKFLGTLREKLKNLPDKVRITLYDASTERELLALDVGGSDEKK